MIDIGSIVAVRPKYHKLISSVLIKNPLIVEEVNKDCAVVYCLRNVNPFNFLIGNSSSAFFDNPGVRASLFMIPLEYLEEIGVKLQEII